MLYLALGMKVRVLDRTQGYPPPSHPCQVRDMRPAPKRNEQDLDTGMNLSLAEVAFMKLSLDSNGYEGYFQQDSRLCYRPLP